MVLPYAEHPRVRNMVAGWCWSTMNCLQASLTGRSTVRESLKSCVCTIPDRSCKDRELFFIATRIKGQTARYFRTIICISQYELKRAAYAWTVKNNLYLGSKFSRVFTKFTRHASLNCAAMVPAESAHSAVLGMMSLHPSKS